MVLFAVLVGLDADARSVVTGGAPHVDSLRLPFLHSTEGVDPKSTWYRFSEAIQRHPLPYFLGTAALLLVLAAPALSMSLGFNDAGNNPPATALSRRAYDLLTRGFGPGFNGKLIVVADISKGGAPARFTARHPLAAADNVAEVAPIVKNARPAIRR